MTIEGLSPAGGTEASGRKADTPEKIKDAAKQFESLLISQLLKGMRESGGGWLGSGEDATAATAMEMAEEELARALSAQGGLGLAQMVAKGISTESAKGK